MDDAPILRAHPWSRRIVLASLIVFAGLGAAGLHLFQVYLDDLTRLANHDTAAAARALADLARWIFLPAGALFALLGAYLGWLAFRSLRAGMFPPRGTLVVKDTPILSGPPARLRAWVLLVIAILCLVVAVFVPLQALGTTERLIERIEFERELEEQR
ncbi:MAG: hypothetical protein AAGD38_10500 [Acidobacteriota bacterium]